MKVDYNSSVREQYLKSKKSIHINISTVRHRVLKAQVALHNTSIQAFLEEVCGLLCEEDEKMIKILKSLDKSGKKTKTKNQQSHLVKEEKDEIYKFIEEQD